MDWDHPKSGVGLLVCAFTLLVPSPAQQVALPPAAQRRVDFARDIEPILKARCYGCHGAAQRMSGLRLDERQAALAGGYSGAVLKPGDSAGSPLIHRVAGLKGLLAMPPAGPKLSAGQIGLLRAWIDQGAKWPATEAGVAAPAKAKAGHWAFQPVQRPAVAGSGNPIDALILARLEKEGIQPSPEADRTTLLRRVSLDLTGLPPTPDEIAEFLADTRQNAYERQVDRLLSSPHYGEKWARHWLDLARYADSDGYEKDWVRPNAWRYRQWVIDALNRDMPFDRFTVEQIAGDLLPGAGAGQRVATGFHRNTLTNREGGVDSAQFRYENTVDRASTVGAVWLGLTVGCAQCHDHKYDPITQKDFYQLFAFFDGVEEVDIDAPMPGEMGPYLRTHAEYRRKRQELLDQYHVPELQAAWEQEMLRTASEPGKRTDWDLAWDCLLKLTEGGDGEKILRKAPAERTERERDVLTGHFIRNYHFAVGGKKYEELKLAELDKKLRALRDAYPQLSQAPAIREDPNPHRSFLRVRGNYKALGIEVQPDVPGALPPLQFKGRATRLDLARWLVAPENPLTARVAVNRIWQEFFGNGIVKTSEDFGTQGERPAHPELLDWLASEFRDSGWSMKHMARLIVTSAAYKRSSKARPDLDARDPENRLLARQSRLRLPAELVRDCALAASGLLDTRIGGPSVRPPQPKGVAELGYANSVKWAESEGADRYRRGLYIHFQRTTPYPLLANFDAPNSEVSTCRRQRSNTPLQALNLLNDPAFVEAAQALAHRVGGLDFDRGLERAWQLALGRQPAGRERERMRRYFELQKAIFEKEPASVQALGAGSAEMAAWTGVASVLFNLDEFIVRE